MAYQELVVSADHMVGKFKWIIRETVSGEKKAVEVYLRSAHMDITPSHSDDEDGRPISGVVSVKTTYKVSRGKYLWVVTEDEIFDSKEEAEATLDKK